MPTSDPAEKPASNGESEGTESINEGVSPLDPAEGSDDNPGEYDGSAKG